MDFPKINQSSVSVVTVTLSAIIGWLNITQGTYFTETFLQILGNKATWGDASHTLIKLDPMYDALIEAELEEFQMDVLKRELTGVQYLDLEN